MTHPQVFGQKFTPIRRFSGWKTHPFWPHIPNMTQYGSAPSPRESQKATRGLQEIKERQFELLLIDAGMAERYR